MAQQTPLFLDAGQLERLVATDTLLGGGMVVQLVSSADVATAETQKLYLMDTGGTTRDITLPASCPVGFIVTASAIGGQVRFARNGNTIADVGAGNDLLINTSGTATLVCKAVGVLELLYGGTFSGSTAPNASYRTLMDSTASHIAARVAGTYFLPQGNPAGITGTGTLYAPNIMYIDPTDYPTMDALTTKLRVRGTVACNDVAPTGTYTFGLHPVTRPATSGGAGLNIYTVGTAIVGSTILLSTPAADSINNVLGSDFAIPAAGHYVIGFVQTGTVAASSHMHMSFALQMRNT